MDDMIVNGIGANRFEFEIIANSAHLSRHGAVTDTVDLGMLPRAIGGTATSFDEHAKLSVFLRGLCDSDNV